MRPTLLSCDFPHLCRPFALFILATLTLAGCSSVPIYSMVRLSQLDPFAMDPNQVKIAVISHRALRVHKGDVQMNLGYQAEDQSLVVQDVYLVEVSGPEEIGVGRELSQQLTPQQIVTVMHLSQADAQQLRASQRLIAQHQQSGAKGQGSFGISVTSSCLQEALPEGELLVSIYLKPAVDSGFIKVIDELDLYQQSDIKDIKDIKNWPRCEASAAN